MKLPPPINKPEELSPTHILVHQDSQETPMILRKIDIFWKNCAHES